MADYKTPLALNELTDEKSHKLSQQGFTIVELMIATLVFSMVLLLITFGVVHFTNGYYKGINSSATQTTAQTALDTISQAIQFSAGGTTTADDTHFCAGNKMFLYNKGKALSGAPSDTNRGLYVLPATDNCSDPGTLPAGGTQLLGQNMRLADISLSSNGPTDPTQPWSISLRIVYGDADLLCSPSLNGQPTGGCSSSAANAPGATFAKDDVQCRAQTGSQFCSVAALSTVVQQRIVN